MNIHAAKSVLEGTPPLPEGGGNEGALEQCFAQEEGMVHTQDGLYVRSNMNKGPWASVWANSAGDVDEGVVVEDMVNAPLLPSRSSISGEVKKVQVKQDGLKKDCP